MCRFKCTAVTIILLSPWFQYILCVGSSNFFYSLPCRQEVSIHPMCRFKKSRYYASRLALTFQYILCVGSREKDLDVKPDIEVFQYILCVGSSQAKVRGSMLLRFNTSYVSVQEDTEGNDRNIEDCFNTSYVSVQDFLQYGLCSSLLGFNTSYVSVQAEMGKLTLKTSFSFNTSYVSVQEQKKTEINIPTLRFQYILCVGSRP